MTNRVVCLVVRAIICDKEKKIGSIGNAKPVGEFLSRELLTGSLHPPAERVFCDDGVGHAVRDNSYERFPRQANAPTNCLGIHNMPSTQKTVRPRERRSNIPSPKISFHATRFRLKYEQSRFKAGIIVTSIVIASPELEIALMEHRGGGNFDVWLSLT
jgi:hypothetical protein